MKYYQIFRSAEPKVIGIKDGTSQVELITKDMLSESSFIDFDNHFSGSNKVFFQNQDKIDSLLPPIFRGVLRKRAFVTDLMQYGQVFRHLYYLYSERYINILKTHNIGEFNLFPFKIENVENLYYLLFVKAIPREEIIFKDSLLYTGQKVLENVKYYDVNNLQQYTDLVATTPLATFEKIAISKEHSGKDLISIQGAANYFYSEKLVDFLLDCGITGLQVGYNNSVQLEFV
ncbi:MAG: hypothetical protein BGO88_03045 [Flavobacterium sp. 38-13]|uniref:hypothetical protein n=1 Tax=Flavobacterium sp. 38-13 TaxID=1896168 RepID=UPI00096829D5|nr:hypothetical protein [Flavobacterium sp. 38-13]OJX54866.1 MAG: hypothetical protein BGO88_03045 [Flavobacterium sp. 38-13]